MQYKQITPNKVQFSVYSVRLPPINGVVWDDKVSLWMIFGWKVILVGHDNYCSSTFDFSFSILNLGLFRLINITPIRINFGLALVHKDVWLWGGWLDL